MIKNKGCHDPQNLDITTVQSIYKFDRLDTKGLNTYQLPLVCGKKSNLDDAQPFREKKI